MHKTPLFLASGLLLSLSAFAMPKVGDFAAYDVVQVKGDQTITATKLVELTQFDAAKNQYLEKVTIRLAGRDDRVSENWTDTKDLLNDEVVDNALAHCTEMGGTLQTTTVPAGTFPTCALPLNSSSTPPTTGTIWAGKVSFGIVHAEIAQGEVKQNISLREFR